MDSLVDDRGLETTKKPDNPGNGGGGGDDGGDAATHLIVTFSDRAGDAITSDGRGAYAHGDCGVDATFSLGDVTLSVPELKGKKLRECGGASRAMLVDYGPFQGTSGFVNVNGIEAIDSSTPVLRDASFVTPECNTLKFHPGPATCDPSFPSCDPSSPAPGSDQVLAWQNSDGTWTIQTADTDADGTLAEAYCAGDGQLYSVPFEVVVEAIQ